ncbi:PilC/PilY family type IV pilus protein [Variovorax sp. J2P1-59]|uniref:PilC/PilY family type IV pilus protein n=1 Tax=Variovorax flavidus TaxID=3053501 RepID=UPI00257519C3|nr:PilC/PilY family type IV pilus protein [Variovorax sp. J2P1-59]MDM0075151.1 PilC/PilY family type IV pilus protein [Variovorax sp. J2P1-59]
MNPTSYLPSHALRAAAAAALIGLQGAAGAASLADQPVFASSNVPGNMALALSVEWPTASRTAHTATYASTSIFLGYFDPDKCYTYQYNAARNDTDTGDTSYFEPTGIAAARRCTGTNDAMWSGNFLNWAATSTIDPFRWAMTGGRRVVDSVNETILEKAWHSGQGLFDDRNLPQAEIAGATPFNTATNLRISINGKGFRMRFSLMPMQSFRGEYFNNRTVTGGAVVTRTGDTADYAWGGRPHDNTSINADNFSVRFTGTFTAPTTGNYVFRTISDDGVRLWIDTTASNNFTNANRVIDNWTDHGATENTSASVALTAGQSYSVKLEHYDLNSSAEIRLLWQTPSSPGIFKKFANPLDSTGATPYQNAFTNDGVYDLTMRNKVCDPNAPGGVETNCKQYGSNWKPEGLVQKYSQRMRFSAFGYLNDASDQRDGGVLRAAQKFVGPTEPVPGLPDKDNTVKEWSATTGVFDPNPNAGDATATTAATGIPITNSGVINYLNKFGQLLPGNYKNYDPVSEMYYAVLRYFKKLGNISTWSDIGGPSTDPTTIQRQTKLLDGFPVVTGWKDKDPIQHSCQRNFILGIGDIYTHVDKNVPGNSSSYRDREPAYPAFSTETDVETVNAITATNKVGELQGLGNLGNSNSYSGRENSAYIAGLAYDANTVDIRPDVNDKQTVQTYWVDVLEQSFQSNNQFYLAAKYGGLKIPKGTIFDPYTATADAIPLDWWSTSGETLTDTRPNPDTVQPRPDNYFTAGRPDTMVDGLTRAFQAIVNEIKAFTTSFSLSTLQVASTGAASYATQYDADGWTGVLTASRITFSDDGTPSGTAVWSSADGFASQLAGSGWNTSRRVVTWNGTTGVPFRSGNLTSAQLAALDTVWATGDDSANYINYLRGDRTNERRTAIDTTRPYRLRRSLLGDIVDAKVVPVGPPTMTFSEAANPGYAAFKTAKASRPTMVYVGANDGMLHAFNGDLDGTGTEQFAYVPSALFSGPSSPATPQLDGLAQLGNPNYDHRFYVDATPQSFDVDFGNTSGNFSTTRDWRTILIGGLGKGGKSFYALDITDPGTATTEAIAKTKVLWEFTDPTMGYSFGSPIVIKTKKYGWVAVLTSGYNNSDGNGYIYFVNPRNGLLLEKVQTGTSSRGLAQATAYIKDFADGTADAVYAGDLDGQLWRFDVTAERSAPGAYPAPLMLATLTNGSAQPITTQPLVEIDPRSKKRYVMFGTGQLLDTIDISSSAPQAFYAILDGNVNTFGTSAQLPSGVSYPLTRDNLTAISNTNLTSGTANDFVDKLGWYVDLGVNVNGETRVGWRMVVNPTAYNGLVAFSSLLTTGNACSPSGQSRIYAIDFAKGKSVLTPDGAAFNFYEHAITDLKFLGVDRHTRLVAGDVEGDLKKVGIGEGAGNTLRLLNWREVPTVD